MKLIKLGNNKYCIKDKNEEIMVYYDKTDIANVITLAVSLNEEEKDKIRAIFRDL